MIPQAADVGKPWAGGWDAALSIQGAEFQQVAILKDGEFRIPSTLSFKTFQVIHIYSTVMPLETFFIIVVWDLGLGHHLS